MRASFDSKEAPARHRARRAAGRRPWKEVFRAHRWPSYVSRVVLRNLAANRRAAPRSCLTALSLGPVPAPSWPAGSCTASVRATSGYSSLGYPKQTERQAVIVDGPAANLGETTVRRPKLVAARSVDKGEFDSGPSHHGRPPTRNGRVVPARWDHRQSAHKLPELLPARNKLLPAAECRPLDEYKQDERPGKRAERSRCGERSGSERQSSSRSVARPIAVEPENDAPSSAGHVVRQRLAGRRCQRDRADADDEVCDGQAGRYVDDKLWED